MLWLLFVIISAIFTVTKLSLAKDIMKEVNQNSYLFISAIVSGTIGLVVLFTRELPPITDISWIIGIGLGLAMWIPANIHMWAIKQGDLTYIFPLRAFTPLYAAAIAFAFLGEIPTQVGIIGMALVILGAYSLNLKEARKNIFTPIKLLKDNRAAQLMLGVTLLFAITNNLVKFALKTMDPIALASLNMVAGTVGFGLVILFKRRNPFKDAKPRWVSIVIAGTINFLGGVFVWLAFSQSFVGYVSAARQAAIILIGFISGAYFFKEKQLFQRLISAIIAAIGVALLLLA